MPDAPLGPHLVRAWNAEGASELKWFSVGSLPETDEVEPNDELGKTQALDKLPLCINGRLDKAGDVDSYTVKLAAGQTLVGIVEAYSLGSGVDMLAHVVDDQGVRVLTASDSRNLDPVVVYKAPKAGLYTVQLAGFAHPPQANVQFAGAASIVYRLHLSAGPVVTEMYPAAVSMAGKTDVESRGYNLDAKSARQTVAAIQGHALDEIITLPAANAVQPLQAVVRDKAALVEKEPNNEIGEAMPLKLGDCAGGHITAKDPMDRYVLQAKKGDRVNLRVFARQLGSALDPVLQIFNAEGKSVINIDDVGENADPQTLWTAPADGAYQIVVQDRFGHGGDNFSYLLEVTPPVMTFEATLADGKPLTLEPGKTAGIKVTVKPVNGFKEPLVIRIANLPAGVHAAEAPVPEKGGETEVKLTAAANAAGSQGPIQVSVWTKAEPASFRLATFSLRGELQRGTSLLDTANSLWLTVKPKL